jgi:hypothetical protein
MTDLVERLRKPIWCEETMKQWDSWRKMITDLPGASLPRDCFECFLDGVDEERFEAATALEAKEAEIAALKRSKSAAIASWKATAKCFLDARNAALARAETAERRLPGLIGIRNMLILCGELGGMQPGESAVAYLRRLIDGLIDAERERDEARAALKPFSDEAGMLSPTHSDNVLATWVTFTVGELRAARAVIEKE